MTALERNLYSLPVPSQSVPSVVVVGGRRLFGGRKKLLLQMDPLSLSRHLFGHPVTIATTPGRCIVYTSTLALYTQSDNSLKLITLPEQSDVDQHIILQLDYHLHFNICILRLFMTKKKSIYYS